MFGFGPPPKRDTKLYEVLGVDPTADASTIKKAYFKLARLHHPDKGGDEEKFKDIQKAYEVLSDEDRRKVYDQTGQTEENAHDGMPFSPFEFPANLFTNGRHQTRREAFPLHVSLEDLYNGVEKKVRITRKVICKSCQGEGGKGIKVCPTCKGTKMEAQRRKMGNMIQEIRRPCMECKAQGRIIQDVCKGCEGQKVVSEAKEVVIPIRKGHDIKRPILLEKMGDERPGVETGDLHVVLQPKEHKRFVLKGDDLIYRHTLTLNEALTGCCVVVEHLDGEKMAMLFKDVIKPDSVFKVVGKGINRKGHLYVKIHVLFPEKLIPDTKDKIHQLLPGKRDGAVPYDAESVEPMMVETSHEEEDEPQPTECQPS